MAEAITTDITRDETTAMPDPAAAEMELNVSLDQLSYICEYCGKVNAISSPGCVRCGKRRPRSEYINAMNKVRNAESVKAQYVEEQARLATEKEEATQRELARLVEDRVADEKAIIVERENARLEQEKDEIKRSTARDAVYRIIEAERLAEQRVQEAERRAQEAVAGRDRATEERIATEREKVLYAAAKRVVSERAGIENAAEERIEAAKRDTEKKAEETIAYAVDEAERNAARKATMKIIAGEQASEDRTRLMRDAISRAAMDRVAEERRIAEINAYSKYQIEREAMQRAVDERIKAEREMLQGRRAQVAPAMPQQPAATAGAVQPFTIVPYVNPQQPVYQYNKGKVVYRFVPDDVVEEAPIAPATVAPAPAPVKKEKKNVVPRVMSVFTFILALVAIAICLAPIALVRFVEGYDNLTVLTSLFGSNDFSVMLEEAGQSGIMTMIPSIAMIVVLAFSAIIVIMSIVGMAKNRQPAIFPVFATLALLGAIAILVSLILMELASLDAILESIGVIALIAVTLIVFIFAIVAAAKTEKKKKAPRA